MAVVTQLFPNFASALAASGSGYNDSDIADVIAFKAALPVDPAQFAPEQALNSILAVGISGAEITNRPLKVLDFGGGCGFNYFNVVSAIRSPLRWAVVETATMAKRATALATGRFEVFTEIAAAANALGSIDLVHASSALQYAPDPLATLKELVALRARHFLLARFPVWRGNQIVGLQPSPLSSNGIGPMPPGIADRQVQYPITFPNFDAVTNVLAEYEVALACGSASSTYEVRGNTVPGVNILFRLKLL